MIQTEDQRVESTYSSIRFRSLDRRVLEQSMHHGPWQPKIYDAGMYALGI